ncbi:uncharacterized protein ACNS7B_018271 isoform 2-T2 [Menidia menidia]
MYRVKPNCWSWSPGPPGGLISQNSRRGASDVLRNQQEEEEGVDNFPPVCHHTMVCDDIMIQAADAQWLTCDPVGSLIPPTFGQAELDQGVHSLEYPATVIEADQGETLQCFVQSSCWESPRMETHRRVGSYRERKPGDLDPCCTASPLMYYGVTRNIVVGVEVVEEVAVEDTLENRGCLW